MVVANVGMCSCCQMRLALWQLSCHMQSLHLGDQILQQQCLMWNGAGCPPERLRLLCLWFSLWSDCQRRPRR